MRLHRQRSPVLAEADEFRIDLVRSEPLRPTGFDERITVAGWLNVRLRQSSERFQAMEPRQRLFAHVGEPRRDAALRQTLNVPVHDCDAGARYEPCISAGRVKAKITAAQPS